MSDTEQSARRRPLLLGHRGCRGAFPENTIAAFDHALAAGCDGFEFDVRLTADRQTVICHDERLSRTRIATATYEQLQKVNMKRFRSRRSDSDASGICSLDDVFQRYSTCAFLNVELKVAGLEEMTGLGLRRHPCSRGAVVSSFLPEVVERMHAIAPEIAIGFIFDKREQLHHWRELPVTYVMPKFKLLTEAAVAEWHKAGKRVVTWTVNDPKLMLRFAEWGVDGVISDDPVLLSNTLGGRAGVPS